LKYRRASLGSRGFDQATNDPRRLRWCRYRLPLIWGCRRGKARVAEPAAVWRR
jgi:hypothetical protein